jgi:hypothetical protein
MLSLRARPEMAPSTEEAMLYGQHEGAFMGNLFGTTPVAKSCAGPGGGNWLRDPQTGAPMAAGRVCAAGTECGFEYVGSCATVCNVQPGGSETLYDECAGNAHVVNTFLYSVEDFDADDGALTTTAIESSGAPMVASADFDRDGFADLAIENNQASIIVKLANGEGGFGPNMTYNLGSGAGVKALIARDLDADGNIDLVTANAASLSVLLGDTKGTFGTPASISVSNAAGSLASVAAGDFNGDGDVDLATNLTSGVGVFLGNGDGTFGGQASYGTSGFHRSLVAGDFDGDGKLDLASASASGASVLVFSGNGNGTFDSPTTVSVGNGSGLARALAAGDFNADGRADLAAAVSGNNHVTVLLGQANGSFSAQSYSIAGSGDTTAVAAAYLDGDASLDVVVTRGDEAVVLSGDASGALTTAGTFTLGDSSSSIVAGHLDLDPRWRTDLLASTDGGDIVLLPGD